jgi:glucosamine-6-phosphate deaminase
MMADIMHITREELGRHSPIELRILPDEASVFQAMAEEMFAYIEASHLGHRKITMVVPVGPVGQYKILAKMCNEAGVSCKNVVFINMDEYCNAAGSWVPMDDPISFRGFMQKRFFSLLEEPNRPVPESCIFPDPGDLHSISRRIAENGGLDVVFGGIGINGHIAFNEPEPHLGIEEYLELSTRVLDLTPETRLINAVGCAGGNIEGLPPKCITIGFKELLSAKRISLYCFRAWQAAVLRKILHGPVTTTCPASLLQKHQDVQITISEIVAKVPLPSVL